MQQQQQHSRKQLAEQGQQQVLQLIRSGKQLLDSYSALQPTSDAQQQLQEVQQQYLQAAADIQATLQQCQALQQQEEAAASAAAAGKCVVCGRSCWACVSRAPVGLANLEALHTMQRQSQHPIGGARWLSHLARHAHSSKQQLPL
jgi:hypothetical protein